MRELGIGLRFILTGCFIIGVINFWTYYDPITAWKTIGSWNNLAVINNLFGILYAGAIIYTFIRIIRNRNLSKNEKGLWGVGTLFVAPVFGTYYIWMKEN